jgi:cytochrome P450
VTIDLDDPAVFLRADVVDDPTHLYDRLREVAPVWKLPGQDAYVVSAPGLIREATGRPSDFSSNLVRLLHSDESGCPVAFDMMPFRDPIHVLPTADPPRHTRHRKLLQSHLTPLAVSHLEPALSAIVSAHLDRFLTTGGDFVAAVSDPVPAAAICTVLGLPHDDVPRIIDMVSSTGGLLDGITDAEGMMTAARSAMDLGLYVFEHLTATIERPVDERVGLLAVLAGAVESGEISASEAASILVVLVSAGSETTSSLLATAAEKLAKDPALQKRLRAEPERIPLAVEDFLRDDGPFQFHYRWATADTSLGGVDIPAGSMVLLMWAAADRPAPGTEHTPHDGTTPPAHYAFGKGMHFCIGAPVARLEARLTITQLLARTTSFRLDPESPPTRRPSIFIRRHATLPLIVETA